MNPPKFVIQRDALTKAGTLSTQQLEETHHLLKEGGLVLLPSDTCYSLAGSAFSAKTADRVNAVLNRNTKDPISVAAGSFRDANVWLAPNIVVETLLEKFTPGPITIVAEAHEHVNDRTLIEDVIKSSDRTIGMRVPDSQIERDICRFVANGLLTTTAVRSAENTMADNTISEFNGALAQVQKNFDRLPDIPWAAIEGAEFYARHSTVVRVTSSKAISLIREGDLAYSEIKATINAIPRSLRR